MKKAISTLALAGLGAALAVGAQAQTITGTGVTGGSYAATFAESNTPGPSPYTYTYTVTSLTNSTNGSINTVTFSGIAGFIAPGVSTFGGAPIVTTAAGLTSLTFNDTALAVGNQFSFLDTLPPTGTVGIVGSANSTGGSVNTGTKDIGPGPAVPEAGSFALLGLGLLPLAFVARRRITQA